MHGLDGAHLPRMRPCGLERRDGKDRTPARTPPCDGSRDTPRLGREVRRAGLTGRISATSPKASQAAPPFVVGGAAAKRCAAVRCERGPGPGGTRCRKLANCRNLAALPSELAAPGQQAPPAVSTAPHALGESSAGETPALPAKRVIARRDVGMGLRPTPDETSSRRTGDFNSSIEARTKKGRRILPRGRPLPRHVPISLTGSGFVRRRATPAGSSARSMGESRSGTGTRKGIRQAGLAGAHHAQWPARR